MMAELRNRKQGIITKSRLKHKNLYNAEWRKYSYQYRCDNPQCVECGANIHPKDGNRLGVVDHRKAVDSGESEVDRYGLMWDTTNHQSMCTRCHNSKSGKEQ